VKDNWIYENTTDNKARFILGEKGGNPLVCFGVNSSTAKPGALDPTLTRVRNRAIADNFNGWIMLNLYPQRATKPQDIHQEKKSNLHKKNLYWINKIFLKYPNVTVWAAWGGLINERDYLKHCLKEIVPLVPKSTKWVRRGSLVGGMHPHHPLYLRNDLPFATFNIFKYLDNLV